MSALNEAYRVLSDPGRRLDYDRQLSAASATSTGPSADRSAKLGGHTGSSQPMTPVYRPAQMPWRSLLISAAVAVVAVVALSQCEGTEPPGPDGILRVGDCAALEPNGDAVEVACTGQDDLVVRAFNPTFDGVCPGLSEPHRDRQGLGVACLERPD